MAQRQDNCIPIAEARRILGEKMDELLAMKDVCWCAPGYGEVNEDGRVVCNECGLVMVASTAGHLIDEMLKSSRASGE